MATYIPRDTGSPRNGSFASEFIRIKIISLGDSLVGKSCLIKRYCEERFVERYITTIGIDYGVKPVLIGGHQVKVNFWDLSGRPEYFEVRNEFYKDSQGGILVYDASNPETFRNLDKWIQECEKFGGHNVLFCVCGNKSDSKVAVPPIEGKKWADKHGFQFFETSAKTGRGVDQLFEYLFSTVTEEVLSQRRR